MATAVEIAGVGIHPFGRFGDTSVVELGTAAVRARVGSADTPASCSGGVAAFMAMVFGCALMEKALENAVIFA